MIQCGRKSSQCSGLTIFSCLLLPLTVKLVDKTSYFASCEACKLIELSFINAWFLDTPYHLVKKGALHFGIWTCSPSLANSGPVIKNLLWEGRNISSFLKCEFVL